MSLWLALYPMAVEREREREDEISYKRREKKAVSAAEAEAEAADGLTDVRVQLGWLWLVG